MGKYIMITYADDAASATRSVAEGANIATETVETGIASMSNAETVLAENVATETAGVAGAAAENVLTNSAENEVVEVATNVGGAGAEVDNVVTDAAAAADDASNI